MHFVKRRYCCPNFLAHPIKIQPKLKMAIYARQVELLSDARINPCLKDILQRRQVDHGQLPQDGQRHRDAKGLGRGSPKFKNDS
jgi:hypothetical protein